jgi:hypothetical protein
MTNNNNHHSNALAFSWQSDTPIEQISPTSGPVPTVQRTNSGGLARLPRRHPLDVLGDISRDPARQSLSPAGEWRIDRPTPAHLSEPNAHHHSHQGQAVPLLQFPSLHNSESRLKHTRPNIGSKTYTSSSPASGGGDTPQDPDNSLERTAG